MAQQPGTGRWDTGVSRRKLETPAFSLPAILCLHYISSSVCTYFIHFLQPFQFFTMLYFLTEGLRLSDITAWCILARIATASLCGLEHPQSLPPLDGGEPSQWLPAQPSRFFL